MFAIYRVIGVESYTSKKDGIKRYKYYIGTDIDNGDGSKPFDIFYSKSAKEDIFTGDEITLDMRKSSDGWYIKDIIRKGV